MSWCTCEYRQGASQRARVRNCGGVQQTAVTCGPIQQHFKINLGNEEKCRILKTEMSERLRKGPPNHIHVLSELGAIPIVEISGGDQLSHPGCEVIHFYVYTYGHMEKTSNSCHFYSHFVQISSPYNTPPRHGPQPAPFLCSLPVLGLLRCISYALLLLPILISIRSCC